MKADLTEQRQQAHSLLDGLPEKQLFAVRNLLELLVEPLSQSLANAPVEQEELTSETMTALHRAAESLGRGGSISHKEILHEYGLCRLKGVEHGSQ